MPELLERLQDASRSGVYRASRPDAIVAAVRGSALALAEIALDGARDKTALLRRIAEALAFPDWFGENWDALEDCLTDLSWREASGHVLLIEGFQAVPKDDLGVLIDVLGAAGELWREHGTPFFAVFVDPQRRLALADLHRES
jgi:hypothetical protein